jgi:type I restriction enzyme S subunit
VVWVTPEDLSTVDGGVLTESRRTISDTALESSNAVLSPIGSLVVSTRAPIGYVAQLAVPAATNQGCRTLVPRADVDSRYFRYQLLSLRQELESRGQGSTFRELGTEELATIPISAPDVDEQRPIADYLDRETARIDRLIAANRRLIDLLTEQFDSTVYALVLGRFDNGPTMPVDIAWVGRVPERWELPMVSANFEVTLGKMLSGAASGGPEQHPYLRNANVQWDRVDLDDLETMHFDVADRARYSLKTGDLLVCEGGEVGRAAVWTSPISDCYFQKAILRVRPRRNGNTRFLMYCLRAAAKQRVFEVEGNQSTIVHLTREKLLAHRFPFPPVSEQTRIVDALDRLGAKHRAIASTVTGLVERLAERRRNLIADAILGQTPLVPS